MDERNLYDPNGVVEPNVGEIVEHGGLFDDLDIQECVTNEQDFTLLNDEDDDAMDMQEHDLLLGNIIGQNTPTWVQTEESQFKVALSNQGSSGYKRKRESALSLLSWVTGYAKNPGDPAIGSLPEKTNQDYWKQVLSFREAVFLKRGSESSSDEQHSWQNQKMHPSLYDDDYIATTYNFREKLKGDNIIFPFEITTKRRSNSNRKPSSCTIGPAGKQYDYSSNSEEHFPYSTTKLSTNTQNSNSDSDSDSDIPQEREYQVAEVPEWTGKVFESDPKWLGTQIWPPPENVNPKFIIEKDLIGKGRQDSCGCPVPDSIECVRFHISEKRAEVKMELGEAFNEWNFDDVGENVQRLWSEEEEKNFNKAVKSNPSSSRRYFWDHILKAFPQKSREELVSYYFNVFILRRRGYQNRHTPHKINSDDDDEDSLPPRAIFGRQTKGK